MTASWVIVSKDTGQAIFETFQKKLAEKVNTEKYDVVPIRKYLASLNKKVENEYSTQKRD